MAFNTGNPIGSLDPRDAADNKENFDKFAVSTSPNYVDRLGITRKTVTGTLQDYAAFNLRGVWVSATAYNVNDVWRDGAAGAFYLVLADYTSGASASADIAAGKVSIFAGIQATDAQMKAGATSLFTDAEVVRKNHVAQVSTIAALRLLEPAFDGQQCELPGHTVAGIGGGVFYADYSSSAADDNGVTIVTAGGKRWIRNEKNYANVTWFGAHQSKTIAENDAAFLSARNSIPFGVIYVPLGTYKLSSKISLNASGYILKGDGPDITVLEFYGDNGIKTGIEVNNGSWDDATETYTFGGTSIGSTKIQDMSIVSATSVDSTGVVFARATKQCSLDRVKIVGWNVPYRMYGSWYAKMNQCSIESNVNPGRVGYETNDFTWFECDHTSNANGHIEFESTGTCRKLQYISGSLDGLPSLFGVYIKNVSSFTFRDVYMEIYSGDSTTAPFVQCGQNSFNVCFDGIDLIYPSDNSYIGKAIALGVGVGSGSVGVGISNFRQYNSASGATISTLNAQEVCFGENVRYSSPIELSSDMSEISPSNQVSILTPSLSGTDEITAIIGYSKRDSYSVINIKACLTGSVDLTGRFLRIIRDDTDAVILNYALGSVTAGVVLEIGVVSGIPKGTALKAYTYKVGSSITWPATTITMMEI